MKLWLTNWIPAFRSILPAAVFPAGRRLFALYALLLIGSLWGTPLFSQASPFADGERLTYEITWPSGLSLGETEFLARATAAGWAFEATVVATLPTLEISDEYHSKADAMLCSSEFEKNAKHGDKKIHEAVEFDQTKHRATRKSLGGRGESEIDIPPCARDGLTFLYYLREQLAAGRIPPPDDINFGAQYQISVTYLEAVDTMVSGEQRKADRILVDLTGPKSQHGFEILLGQDDARTPLLMQIPFEMGTFSLRLSQ